MQPPGAEAMWPGWWGGRTWSAGNQSGLQHLTEHAYCNRGRVPTRQKAQSAILVKPVRRGAHDPAGSTRQCTLGQKQKYTHFTRWRTGGRKNTEHTMPARRGSRSIMTPTGTLCGESAAIVPRYRIGLLATCSAMPGLPQPSGGANENLQVDAPPRARISQASAKHGERQALSRPSCQAGQSLGM